jgi:hypothetical protein
MLEEVKPTIENCLQLCTDANEKYKAFLDNPPKDELDMIDWRVIYNPLFEFDFPEVYQNNEVVLLFKEYHEVSADYFYSLMEKNELENITERVYIGFVISPKLNLFYPGFTAVSPKDVSKINIDLINEALLNSHYNSFYVDDQELDVDVNTLSASAFAIYIAENKTVVTEKSNGVKYLGQLIIHKKNLKEIDGFLSKEVVFADLERVR